MARYSEPGRTRASPNEVLPNEVLPMGWLIGGVGIALLVYLATQSGGVSRFDRATALRVFQSLAGTSAKSTSSSDAVSVVPDIPGTVSLPSWAWAVKACASSSGAPVGSAGSAGAAGSAGFRPLWASNYWFSEPTRTKFLRVGEGAAGYSLLAGSLEDLNALIYASEDVRKIVGV